jgi:hypothetical protein
VKLRHVLQFVLAWGIRITATIAAYLLRSEAVPTFIKRLINPFVLLPSTDLLQVHKVTFMAQETEAALKDPVHRLLLLPWLEPTSSAYLLSSDISEKMLPLLTARLLNLRTQEERSRALKEVIVEKQLEVGPRRLTAALRVVQRAAETITSDDAGSIFRACVKLSEGTVDPYQSHSIGIDARLAAASILQHHPQLDESVASNFSGGPTFNLQTIVAASLRLRPLEREQAFLKYVGTWRPPLDKALLFAIDCDLKFSAADPIAVRERKRTVQFHRLQDRFGPWTAVLLGPLLLLVGGALQDLAEWHPSGTQGLASPIAGIAILVTAHVLAAELSAARLPGLIARHSASSSWLIAAYSVGMTLLLTSATSDDCHWCLRIPDASATLTLVLFVLIVFVLWDLIKRTDPPTAALRFARSRGRRNFKAGQQLGHAQATAFQALRDLRAINFVRLVSSPAKVERRVPFGSPRRGLFLPDVRGLRSLSDQTPWIKGVIAVHLGAHIGTIVSEGEEIASLVPGTFAGNLHPLLGSIRKCLRVIDASGIEEAAEASAVLTEMIALAAKRGDEGAAARLIDVLAQLIDTFSHGARNARAMEEEKVPVNPVQRTAVAASIGALLKSETEVERTILSSVMGRLLDLGGLGDGVPTLIAARIDEVLGVADSRDSALQLLRLVGIRATELGETGALLLIEDRLERELAHPAREQVLEVAANLTAITVWLHYFRAQGLWDWYWTTVSTLGNQDLINQVLGAVRIGAAALLSGAISVACHVARKLWERGIDFGVLEQILKDRSVAAREQALSDLFGGYAGVDAEASFRSFARFGKDFTAAVQ